MTATTIGVRSALLILTLTSLAGTAMAQSIEGSATYRERMALPPGAVLEAVLEDVSRADAPAEAIAQGRVESPGNPPIAFTIAYDPAKIQANTDTLLEQESSLIKSSCSRRIRLSR